MSKFVVEEELEKVKDKETQKLYTNILSEESSEVITMKIEKVAIVGRGALGILYGAHFTEKL